MCNVSVCQMKIAIRLNCMAKQQKQNNEKKAKTAKFTSSFKICRCFVNKIQLKESENEERT